MYIYVYESVHVQWCYNFKKYERFNKYFLPFCFFLMYFATVCLFSFYRFHVGGFPENMLVGDGIVEPYEEIEGGNIKVPSGMSTIVQKLQVSPQTYDYNWLLCKTPTSSKLHQYVRKIPIANTVDINMCYTSWLSQYVDWVYFKCDLHTRISMPSISDGKGVSRQGPILPIDVPHELTSCKLKLTLYPCVTFTLAIFKFSVFIANFCDKIESTRRVNSVAW